MKKFILLILLAVSLLANLSPVQAADVRELSWTELQAQMRSNSRQNVIIEFYSSKTDGLECDRCTSQEAVFQAIAAKHGDEISFVRVDVASAPFLIEIGTVGIYPTHLFVRHEVPEGQEIVAKRVRGFLTTADFHSLIEEFFEIQSR